MGIFLSCYNSSTVYDNFSISLITWAGFLSSCQLSLTFGWNLDLIYSVYLRNAINLDVTFAVMVLRQLISHFLSLSACLWVLLHYSLYCHGCWCCFIMMPRPCWNRGCFAFLFPFTSAQRKILDLSTCSNCYVYLPAINIVPVVLVWFKYFHKGAISSTPVSLFRAHCTLCIER